jgi:hypothetical protein
MNEIISYHSFHSLSEDATLGLLHGQTGSKDDKSGSISRREE